MIMHPIKVSSTNDRYRQKININDKFELTADEPISIGGNDAGATPVELVVAGLGSCKAITLKMYAERKGWELTHVDANIFHQKINQKYQITAHLHLEGDLTDEQKQRLLEIADKCPVHKLLQSSVEIETLLT